MGWLKLHNEALHHLFCSPYIFRVITTGQVASMTQVTIAHKSVLIKSRLVYGGNTAVNAGWLDEK